MGIVGGIRRLFGRPTRAQLERSHHPEIDPALAARYLPPGPVDVPAAGSSRELTIITKGSWIDSALSSAAYKLTPDRLFQIYTQAENGYPGAQCDAFEGIQENDGHLTGLYTTRRDEVLGMPWSLLPGDDRAGSVMAAQTLGLQLDDTNFDVALEHWLTSVFFGYGNSETQWGLDGTWVRPRWFVNVPHRRFIFDRDDVPHLTQDGGDSNGIPLSADPWRWAIAQRYHRRAVRAGVYRTTSWWALFKRMSVRDWMAFAEKFGIPMILGKYSEDAPPEARLNLEQAVRRIGWDGNAIMHEETRIEVLDNQLRVGDSTALHPAIIATANAEMSKAVTGATLNAETGGPGSFALGKVHAGRAKTLSVADARYLARVFRAWARLWMDLNGIENASAPRLHIGLLPEDPLQDSQMLRTLAVDMGLPVSKSQLYQRYALKQPSNPADKLEPPANAPAAAADRPSAPR